MAEDTTTGPITCAADDGYVVIDGQGFAATLDPETALLIADRITDAASEAIGQRRIVQLGRSAS